MSDNCYCCVDLIVDEEPTAVLSADGDAAYDMDIAEEIVIGGGGIYQSKTINITPTESAQSQTVHADVGYDALDEVEVNVSAVSDTYVGSAVPRRASSSLTVSGNTVTAPAGYYASDADKTMTTGHMSVSATKGSVSNHSVSVTPKAAVDNAGYFATGDRTGTAVSVSASELVSGSETKTQNGTYDVTNLAELVVNVSAPAPSLQTKTVSYTPTTSSQSDQVTPDAGYDGLSKVNVSVAAMPSGTEGTPTATKGAVSNHSVSVTPSVTNTAGYISGGTKTGTAVTVSASELDSGTKSITSNGNAQDVVGYAAVNVNVPNSYASADEGKVVDNGALVSQTSDTVTQNGTVDTTLINSLTVNVSGGGGVATGTFTPVTNTNGYTLDVGIDCTYFAIYLLSRNGQSPTTKYFLASVCDFSGDVTATNRVTVGTNNSGSSIAGSAAAAYTWWSKSGTTLTCISGTSGANYPGWFYSGITYKWFAI